MVDTFEPLTTIARKAILTDMALELAHLLGVPRSSLSSHRITVRDDQDVKDGLPVLKLMVESRDWIGMIAVKGKPHLYAAKLDPDVGG